MSIRLLCDIHTVIENWARWAIDQTATWESVHEEWTGAQDVFRDVIAASNENDGDPRNPDAS